MDDVFGELSPRLRLRGNPVVNFPMVTLYGKPLPWLMCVVSLPVGVEMRSNWDSFISTNNQMKSNIFIPPSSV